MNGLGKYSACVTQFFIERTFFSRAIARARECHYVSLFSSFCLLMRQWFAPFVGHCNGDALRPRRLLYVRMEHNGWVACGNFYNRSQYVSPLFEQSANIRHTKGENNSLDVHYCLSFDFHNFFLLFRMMTHAKFVNHDR